MSLCERYVVCNDSIISALTCSLVRIRKGSCNGVFSSQFVGIPGFKLAVVGTFAKS